MVNANKISNTQALKEVTMAIQQTRKQQQLKVRDWHNTLGGRQEKKTDLELTDGNAYLK